MSDMNHLPKSGIGLRTPHVQELLSFTPNDSVDNIGFLEAHSENFFCGGADKAALMALREKWPISLHGIGLSLGRADGLDQTHLKHLKSLIDEVDPLFVSEHLSWSAYSHSHAPDLLPVPATNEALKIFVDHVSSFQETIGRQILIENPSNYLAFKNLDYTEPEFLNLIAEQSGCGLLLDLNNIIVSAHNLGYDANRYIDTIDPSHVKQFHLAGYQINTIESGETLYLDTHGYPVYPETWNLFERALNRFGDTPTLIEWDTDIPALDTLIAEAHKADVIRSRTKQNRKADNDAAA